MVGFSIVMLVFRGVYDYDMQKENAQNCYLKYQETLMQ